MKQRVRVIGLVEKDGSFLLAKKRMGRLDSGDSIWELPTGKINFGEQPEESITRTIFENFGINVSSLKLRDVITFLALAGASQLNNLYIVYNICIQDDDKIKLGDKYTSYKFFKKNGDYATGICLDEASSIVLNLEYDDYANTWTNSRNAVNGFTIYVDGCSKGNPGPSGIGYIVLSDDGRIIKRGREFVGFATSRMAEYYALRAGCEVAIKMGVKNVRFVSDSLMMINQMNGIYKIKNQDLIPIYNDIREMLSYFKSCIFTYVNREQNTEADREANAAVDGHFNNNMIK